ncbi:MAG: type II secretion system protein N [Planctomycetota bacterium]
MYTHKALVASKLTLAIVLLFALAKVVIPPGRMNKIPAPAAALNTDGIQIVDSTSMPNSSLKDYAQIASRSPFGTSGSPDGIVMAGSFDHSISEQLGLALLGTVSGSQSVARAIIKNLKTGVFELYKIGQMVGGNRIEAIETDAIVLLHNGTRKKMWITTWPLNNNNNDYMPSPSLNSEITKALQADRQEKNTSAESTTIAQRAEEVLTKAIIKPHVVDGQTDGLVITGLENIEAAKKFGLKNGDVIHSVNGYRLTSKQKAYQVFKKARSKKTMTLDLSRGGRHKKFSFTL